MFENVHANAILTFVDLHISHFLDLTATVMDTLLLVFQASTLPAVMGISVVDEAEIHYRGRRYTLTSICQCICLPPCSFCKPPKVHVKMGACPPTVLLRETSSPSY